MPIIEWKVTDLVGIGEIDQQHKQLVQMVNNSYDSFRAGTAIGSSFVDELAEYAASHFATEEALMATYRYPGLMEHKQEHEIFTRKVEQFRKSHRKNNSVEIIWFLCNWITHHMRETDASFGNFVVERNLNKAV